VLSALPEILDDVSHEPARPLRIAHVTTVDMSLALLLATELDEDRRAGHTVFGISAAGPYVERVEKLGVTFVPIRSFTRSWSLLADVKAFFEIFRTLRKLRLDVVHTHTPKAGVMGRIAGRLARVPVVVNTCHGLWARPEDRLLKRTAVYGAEALAIRFSDYELFQNAEDSKTLRRFLKKDRWKVVGNGIDLDRFKSDPQGRTRLRAEWGISDDELVVGIVGRRVREKGLAEFTQAAQRLQGRATFVWVGPADDTDAVASTGHEDSAIRFVGEYADMPAVYSAFDIFVLPSYREGFSRASMEAAACGKPMVLSDIRGCREIGTNEEHLLLVPPYDGSALARAVERLLEDTDLREKLSTALSARAHACFDQREVAHASLTAYADVSARKGR
jgi:glycosyltransferase involved in cell wall biosynthesis